VHQIHNYGFEVGQFGRLRQSVDGVTVPEFVRRHVFEIRGFEQLSQVISQLDTAVLARWPVNQFRIAQIRPKG